MHISKYINPFLLTFLMVLNIPFITICAEDGLEDIADDELFEEMIGPIKIVDESPKQILDLLANLTGVSIIPSDDLPVRKINFTGVVPLSVKDTIVALESALAVNGIGLAPIGEKLVKAVPLNATKGQSPEFLIGSPLDIEPTQKTYTKLFEVQHVSPAELRGFITPLLTPGSFNFSPFNRANTLLVTDTAVNLQTVQKVLDALDRPLSLQNQVHFYTLKNSSATEAQKQLNRVLNSAALKNNIRGVLTIEANNATNQLIVITHEDNKPFVESLINGIDISVEPFTKNRTFAIRYAEAPKVAELIQKIIDNQNKAFSDRKSATQGGPTATASSTSADSLQFSEFVTIVPDERSNAIVAYGNKSDLEQIERLIEDIDIVLPQVRIEVVIAEVTLTKNMSQGLDAFNFKMDTEKTIGFSFDGAKQVGGGDNSFSVQHTFSPKFDLGIVLKNAKSNNNVSVLSSPTLLTTHNKEAHIEISEERPIVKNQLTNNNSDSPNQNVASISSTIEFKSIGIRLEIKPLIGKDGVIQLDIKQIIDELNGEVEIGGGVKQPIIAKREAKSFISIADREVVVLGGLQKISHARNKGKLAFVGDLPIVGRMLGKNESKQGIKQELIVFIKPYILNNPTDSKADTQRMISNLDETGESIKTFYETGKFDDTQVKNVDKRKFKKHKSVLDNFKSPYSSKYKKAKNRY